MSPQPLAADPTVDTRTLLLDAAAREIHVRGFQAASVSRILAETGVTKGALYHYFSSKAELGYAVFDEVYAPQLREVWITPLEQGDGDPLQSLIDIITAAGKRMTEADVARGCPINNLAQEMSPVDAGFRGRIERLFAQWRDAIERALLHADDAGTLCSEVDAKSAATFIVASLEGCIGMAKNAQSHAILMQCGHGLIAYLQSLRHQAP